MHFRFISGNPTHFRQDVTRNFCLQGNRARPGNLYCAGDTCRAGSAQTHFRARLCARHLSTFTLRSEDTGTEAFPVSSLEKQSFRWPYISRLSVLSLPDQTSTSCSGSLGSYMPRPLTQAYCVTRRASWELSAPPPGWLCKLQLPAVCAAARHRSRGPLVGLPGGLAQERQPC